MGNQCCSAPGGCTDGMTIAGKFGSLPNFGPAPSIPFFKRNRLVWHAGGSLSNNIVLFDNTETFEAQVQQTDLNWHFARQIDERRVIMIQSAGQICKMVTWGQDGTATITFREPRRSATYYPAVCNDGDRWFFSIAGYETTVERHDIANNSWQDMPRLNVARNAAAAVVLHHVAYVFCGAGAKNDLNSIERLALEGASGRVAHEEAWQIIEVPENILSPRYYPAVIALNHTEIVILAGYSSNDGYKGDVMLFNTQDNSVNKVVELNAEAGDIGYYPNTNQGALIAPEQVVVLCGVDGNNQPILASWKKGGERIELIHRF